MLLGVRTVRSVLLALVVGAVLSGCKDFSIPTEPLMAAGQYGRIAAILGLSAEQSAAAKDLYAAYTGDFGAARAKLQAYYEKADRVRQDTGDEEGVQKAKERARAKFDKYSSQLRGRLLDDLRAVVTSEQMVRWPLVERLLRREELGEWGGLHGSGVDVAAAFETVEQRGDRTPQVQRALDEYEDAIDRPLLEGRKAKAEWAARQKRAAKRSVPSVAIDEAAEENGVADQVAVTEEDKRALSGHLARVLEISKGMQRLNMRTADQIADAMPPLRTPAFRGEFNRRAFGEFSAPTAFNELLERVDALEDLSDEQRLRLARLRTEYGTATGSSVERIARAVVAWEQSREVRPSDAGEEPEPTAVTAAKGAHGAIDARFRRELAGLLTPAQLELFPGLLGNERLSEIEF